MKLANLLLIHHAKNFESNSAYLSDSYHLANSSLFGAQEMDSWGGYRILQSLNNVYRLQISPHLGRFQVLSGANIILEDSFTPNILMRQKITSDYIWAFMKYRDTSIAINSSSAMRRTIQDICKHFRIQQIWADTQFYDSLMPDDIPVITRSVNYEPFHVLREDPSMVRHLRYLLKISSEKEISRKRLIASISPRDARFYSRLNHKHVHIVPLRQLPFLLASKQEPSQSIANLEFYGPFIHFAGSNFDVKHNRDNLRMVLHEVAPKLKEINRDLRILIFGHRFPQDLKCPSNVMYMHFRDDFHALIRNSIGAIVPTGGGAGMQSKVFEPLCSRIPLIANEKAIAGYPFNAKKHYWRGNSTQEIIHSIKQILDDRDEVSRRLDSSMLLAKSIFDLNRITQQMKNLLTSN